MNQKDDQDQIQEFLNLHKGPGVQHLALLTPNILSAIEELQTRKMKISQYPSYFIMKIFPIAPLL